jgi:hypothetical protein
VLSPVSLSRRCSSSEQEQDCRSRGWGYELEQEFGGRWVSLSHLRCRYASCGLDREYY